jgi:hypothetical protein
MGFCTVFSKTNTYKSYKCTVSSGCLVVEYVYRFLFELNLGDVEFYAAQVDLPLTVRRAFPDYYSQNEPSIRNIQLALVHHRFHTVTTIPVLSYYP